MVDKDWADLMRFMAEYGRPADDLSKVYSNFVYVLKPGERPESAAPFFRTYSGMDLEYWQEFYLLGEAEQVAERIRGKIAALGGVDHVILNPLDWDPERLDMLARDVLPLVTA
jgi:alkanesulfonate monooxygenase SsuD/methylene tetrahydromethanopterin reductase-like flavin-dependent oxidoreductase (luciferase family)